MKIISVYAALIISILDPIHSQTWEPLGAGMDGPVYDIKFFNNELVAGGNYTSAGNVFGTRFIAKWNGSVWSPVGPANFFTGPVYALTVHNNELIAAGDFNPGNLFKIAKWNGNSWVPLGNGYTDGVIWTVCSNGGFLYAGGTFTQIAGVPANRIAKWNGTSWSAMGSGTNGTVVSIAEGFSEFSVAVGGSFTNAGGVTVQNVAYCADGVWIPMGSGLDGVVNTLYNNSFGVIIAGGGFTSHVKRFEGSDWTAIGGLDTGSVFTLSAVSGNIFAGGMFNFPGIIPGNIAYNNGSWISLGSMNDYVYKIYETVLPYSVYAAGRFTTAGGVTVNRITRLSQFYPVYRRIMLNKSIPDNSTVYDTIHGPQGNNPMNYVIADVNLTIDTVFHSNDSDLEITLLHNGILDTAIYRAGGSGDNFIGTLLNDSAAASIESGSAPFNGQFRPSKPLSKFNGTSINGDWILQIYDRATGSTGVLQSWSLSFRLQEVIGIHPVNSTIPAEYNLFQNYPNPFNPSTRIRFSVPEQSDVKLMIYDVLGRHITTLVNKNLNSGTYEADWNAENDAAGVYFFRLTSGDFSETKKMILIK